MLKSNTRRALSVAAAAMVTVLTLDAAVRADEQIFLQNDFESVAPFIGAPNTGALGIPGVNFFSYSGLDTTFTRREGIDTDGVGGSHAIFQTYDGAAASSSFFYYAGLGSYFYVDNTIGLPLSTPDKLKITFDTKGIGQVADAPQATMRVQIFNDAGNGAAYVAILPLAISSSYTTQGGTFDTFFEQDADPDFGGPLPAGPSVFNGRNAFQFQIDTGQGGFGFDNGNKLSLDNLKITVIRPVYHGGAASNYTDAANWSEGTVPNSTTAFPQFGANGEVARAITLNSAVTVNRLDFAGLAGDTNTISGTGSITIQGDSPGLFDHEGTNSTQTINVPVLLAKSGKIRVNAGDAVLDLAGGVGGTGNITKDRNGRLKLKNLRAGGTLSILGGAVEIANGIGNNSTSVVTDLTISSTEPTAALQLNDARMIVDYTGASPLAKVVASVKAGDIIGTTTTPLSQSVAVVERSSLPAGASPFGGIAADSTSLLMLVTLKGDTNLTRLVDFDDLVSLAQHYNQLTGGTWDQGDFDYDADIDFDDLVSLAQNYNGTFNPAAIAALGSDFAADWAIAQSIAPEPGTLAAVMAASALAAARRRK